MKAAVDVTLPGGYWLNGTCHREASLSPLNGEDEAFLLELGGPLRPAQWTTALLTRCMVRLGSLDRITEKDVRSLTVGDREALLLHLRRLTLGDRLQCVLDCPSKGCGEKMDLDLRISSLLLPIYPSPQEDYELLLSSDERAYKVHFRLPTGADQEAIAGLAEIDLGAAAEQLLHHCVKSITVEGHNHLRDIPLAVARQLSSIIAELDPQAELLLDLTCPECGNRFSALFDTASYFFQELSSRIEHVYREVHVLAFYYHWSEAEILSMTPGKRQRYLELLDEELGERR